MMLRPANPDAGISLRGNSLPLERRDPAALARLSGSARVSYRAFTLIELILILALLAVVTSLAAPALSNFFRGRVLSSEAQQLLSLTHAAQSRAVSEGFPVLLWIDTPQGEYGLQLELSSQKTGSREIDHKAEQFTSDRNLTVEVLDAAPVMVNGQSMTALRFLPDGTVDEASPTTIRISSNNGGQLWLIQATNRLNYEIRHDNR